LISELLAYQFRQKIRAPLVLNVTLASTLEVVREYRGQIVVENSRYCLEMVIFSLNWLILCICCNSSRFLNHSTNREAKITNVSLINKLRRDYSDQENSNLPCSMIILCVSALWILRRFWTGLLFIGRIILTVKGLPLVRGGLPSRSTMQGWLLTGRIVGGLCFLSLNDKYLIVFFLGGVALGEYHASLSCRLYPTAHYTLWFLSLMLSVSEFGSHSRVYWKSINDEVIFKFERFLPPEAVLLLLVWGGCFERPISNKSCSCSLAVRIVLLTLAVAASFSKTEP